MSGNDKEYAEIAQRNRTGRECKKCGNDIRKSDDRATERLCGFCATVPEPKCGTQILHRGEQKGGEE
jgi:hypothetical protein